MSVAWAWESVRREMCMQDAHNLGGQEAPRNTAMQIFNLYRHTYLLCQ